MSGASAVGIVCPGCGARAAPAAVSVAGDRVTVTCGGCGSEHPLVAKAEPSPRAGVPVGAECPKCGEEAHADAAACPRCGLDSSRWGDFADGAAKDPAAEPVPDAVVEAWRRCDEAFDDAARHEAFRERVAAASAYRYAARQYRIAARDPGRAAIARQRAERIRRMAEAALLARPQAPRTRRRSGGNRAVTTIAIAVFLLAAAAIGVYLILRGMEAKRDGPVKKPVHSEDGGDRWR